MKIVGIGVCGPNEKRLTVTLDEFARLCDDVIIVGNNIDSKSRKIIKDYGFQFYNDNREWGLYQPKIKETLLKEVGRMKPDWIIALDMDEVFDKNFTREEAEKLAEKGGLGYYFYVTNLYEDGYSKDWSFWNIRYFKYSPDHGLEFEDKNVHPGLAPKIVYYWGNYAPFILKHYGLKDKEDRDKKIERYKQYDPTAQFKGKEYYDFLASKYIRDVFDEKKLHDLVEDEVKDYYHKPEPKIMENTKPKYYFVKRQSDGMIIDIPASDLEETLNRGGFELVTKDPVSIDISSPVQTTKTTSEYDETASEYVCTECGFIAESAFGLRSHKRIHNKPKESDGGDNNSKI